MFSSNAPQKISSALFLARLNQIGYLPDVWWHYILRRTFLLENDIKFINAKVGEDQGFVTEVLVKTKDVVLLPHTFYWHREKVGGQKTLQDAETTVGFLRLIDHLSFLESQPSLSREKTDFLLRRKANAEMALGARLILHNETELSRVQKHKYKQARTGQIIGREKMFDQNLSRTALPMMRAAYKNFSDSILSTEISSSITDLYLFCYSLYTLAALRVLQSQGYRVLAIVDNNSNAKGANEYRLISPDEMLSEVTDWETESKHILVCSPRRITSGHIQRQLISCGVPQHCIGQFVLWPTSTGTR